LILENLDITKSALDSYIAKHSNAKDCAKDAIELGLDFLIMVGKGIEMINNKILSATFNTIFGEITVDNSPIIANFVYWTVKKWKDYHIDII
jgi:dsRNA-specific ribonuclease